MEPEGEAMLRMDIGFEGEEPGDVSKCILEVMYDVVVVDGKTSCGRTRRQVFAL
jgi:hypothetical protein